MFLSIYIPGTVVGMGEWRESTITEVRFYNKYQMFHAFSLTQLFEMRLRIYSRFTSLFFACFSSPSLLSRQLTMVDVLSCCSGVIT